MTTDPRDDDRTPKPPAGPAKPPPGTRKPETTPAEERGERIDTGKTIARGGKTEGTVPGAEPADGQPGK
jgi:hypothetical protein